MGGLRQKVEEKLQVWNLELVSCGESYYPAPDGGFEYVVRDRRGKVLLVFRTLSDIEKWIVLAEKLLNKDRGLK